MKTLALLSLSIAVALGMPPFAPGVAQNPVLTKEDQSALLGDWVPEQGHVVVDEPVPQVRLVSEEQQEKLAPVPVDMEQSQSMVELEVKVKPEVGVEQEGGVKTEVKKEPEIKAEPQIKVEQEVKVEQEGMVELEVKVKPQVKVEQELKAEPEVKVEPEVKMKPEVEVDLEANVEPEVNLNPDVMAELEVNMKPEVEMEPEFKDDPDFKVESEVKVEPEETESQVKPMFNEEQEVQDEFHIQINLEAETETGREFDERHIDMEGKYEMVDEPIMELEPLDDDNMFGEELSKTELSEVEKSLRAAFQNQDPVIQRLAEEEEEGLMREGDNVLDGEPIMDLEPEMREEPFLRQRVMPDAAIMEEGPALDIMGQPMHPLEGYFPNEEARMEMEPGQQQDPLTVVGSDYLIMEEQGREFVREEEQSPMVSMPLFEEPAMEDSPVLHESFQFGVGPKREKRTLMRQATGRSYCPGVVLVGKCYQFFKGPKRAADAEFFCQKHSPGGHLASITSQHIHRQVMNMMLQQNGAYTRTWIGGLRYLETGHFIWLDGSHWGYADWLSGEPNNTADVEDCVEVLAHGNGKFNDFTCWEPQAFICSYPY